MTSEAHEWEIKRFLQAALGGAGGVLILLGTSIPFAAKGDPFQLFWIIISATVKIIVAIAGLAGGLLFFDHILKGSFLDGITDGEITDAMLGCSLVLVLGYILAGILQ